MTSPTSFFPRSFTADKKRHRYSARQSVTIDPNRPQGPPLLPHASSATTFDGPDFEEFFKQHTCYDLVPTSSKIVVLDTTLSARKAFYALIHNSVRAGILWSASQGQFTGLLTITDFIRVILDHWDKLSPGQQTENSVQNTTGLSAIEEQTLEEWRAGKTACSDSFRPLKFTWISAQDSMLTALETFSHNRIHRLPVIDTETGNVVSVLSHKRILKFFHMCLHSLFPSSSAAGQAGTAKDIRSQSPVQATNSLGLSGLNATTFSTLLSKSLTELGVGTYGEKMLVSYPDESVAAVLRRMINGRVSALPVMERKTGRIISVYSRFDAIFLAADGSYAYLATTVSEALAKRPNRVSGNTVLSCKPDEPLGVVVDRFVNEQVHRLIAVDDDGNLIGIVSLSDVLRCLAGLTNPSRGPSLNVVPPEDHTEKLLEQRRQLRHQSAVL